MMTNSVEQHEASCDNVMRQVRLRQAAAHLYPYFPAGEWLSAEKTAAHLLQKTMKDGDAQAVRHRILPDEHFEFRGGRRETPIQYRARTRWVDCHRPTMR